MQTTAFLSLALIVLMSASAAGKQYEYRIDLKYGGSWRDCEKSRGNKNDDWLCWAAAASNVLAWTGWGKGFRDEDTILKYFSEHWQDKPDGSPRAAWKWWFTGSGPTSGAQVRVPGGGFWKNVGFPNYYWRNRVGALYRGIGQNNIRRQSYVLKRVLDEGYGVAIQIVRPLENKRRKSHMITLWGYRYSKANPFAGILITDSDDNKRIKSGSHAKNRLRYFPVTRRADGMWWFRYRDQDWKILAAYALQRRAAYSGRR